MSRTISTVLEFSGPHVATTQPRCKDKIMEKNFFKGFYVTEKQKSAVIKFEIYKKFRNKKVESV